MTIKKKLLSAVLSLALTLQADAFLLSVNAYEEANLFANGSVEDAILETNGDITSGKVGNFEAYGADNSVINVEQTTAQAYSGDKSVLIKKLGSNSWAQLYAYKGASSFKANTTYIANIKILGTEKNANEGWETVVNKGSADEQKVRPFLIKNYDLPFEGYTMHNTYSLNELDDAPYANAENQTKLGKEAWKDLTMTFTTGDTLALYGIGLGFLHYNSEIYADDFYMGELIVADVDVQNTTSQNPVVIPVDNESAQLELSAKALNQLGTEAGLQESTFTWEITDENKDGVSIKDGKLIITNEANVRTLNLKVTANPTFTGSDTQTESQKEGRSKIVQIELEASPEASRKPKAKEIKFEGVVEDGETLTLSYKYWQVFNVPQGETEITWYRCTSYTDVGTPFNHGELTYLLEEGDDEFFYRAEIKPISEEGDEGNIYKTQILCQPFAPVASNVKVSGIQAIDEEWEVSSYDYYDKNGDEEDEPLYQWFVSETKNVEDGVEIKGATAKKYKITDAEAEKYVYAGVKAVSKKNPKEAEEFSYSEPRLTSAVPKVTDVKIEKKTTSLVVVKYNYSHPFEIGESGTKIEWYNGNELIGEGKSLDVSKLKGEKIEARVTPMADKKPHNGKTVTADYKVPFGSSSVGGPSVSSAGGGSVVKPEIHNIPSWAKAEIDYVLENKIMDLAAENDFGGNTQINRGEFMMAILKAAGIQPSDYRGSFTDVTSLDKFSGYLQSAFDQGVISAADSFYPARELTRDEMCKIIVASIEAMTKKEISKVAITHFTDYNNIQSWAIDFISEAVATGIIKGNADGSMNPKGNVTRAEAAVIAKRIVEYVNAGGLK